MRKNYHHSPKLFLLAFLFLIAFSNCSKKNRCHYVSIPSSLFFLLKKDGSRLPDSVLNNLKMSYYENSTTEYVSDLGRATEEGYNLGVMTTRLIGDISADKNIKMYFIEYPNGEKDTLSVDYQPPSINNGCHYNLIQVKFNGKEITPDPAITMQKVYTLANS